MKAALQPLKFSVDPFFQKMRAEEASVNDLARMLDAARMLFLHILTIIS